jgi:hypothetical protein
VSRTDKDRPWQIRANDMSDLNNGAYWFHNNWAHARLGGCTESCGWTLPHMVLSQPPHDYVHVVWYGPERARERTELGRLAREWNAHGELSDGDFANWQHRHSAAWTWC